MEQTNRESALEAILFALGEPVEDHVALEGGKYYRSAQTPVTRDNLPKS